MLPYQQILCPVDFSEPSLTALSAAEELAIHFQAGLTIVHVVPVIPPVTPGIARPRAFDVGAYQGELEVSSLKALEDLIAQRLKSGLKVCPLVLQGDAATEIVGTAAREAVDLIVIATHGHTGWRHYVFGSVAEKVVRASECPVLTIREPGPSI
jgi:universal stress protein A